MSDLDRADKLQTGAKDNIKWPTKEQVINAAKKDIAVNSDDHSYERYRGFIVHERYRGFIVGAAWMRAQVEVEDND